MSCLLLLPHPSIIAALHVKAVVPDTSGDSGVKSRACAPRPFMEADLPPDLTESQSVVGSRQ